MIEFLTAHRSCTAKYFWKTLIEDGSSHLYASFGTFCVQIGQLFKAQRDFKLSEKFEIDVIFLPKQRFYRFQTFFKDALFLEKMTNLDVKGATNHKRSFKNILLYINAVKNVFSRVFTPKRIPASEMFCIVFVLWKLATKDKGQFMARQFCVVKYH